MITRLDNLGIAVRDAQKAVEFRKEKFGLQARLGDQAGASIS